MNIHSDTNSASSLLGLALRHPIGVPIGMSPPGKCKVKPGLPGIPVPIGPAPLPPGTKWPSRPSGPVDGVASLPEGERVPNPGFGSFLGNLQQAYGGNEGVQAAGANEGVQAAGANEGRQAASGKEGRQAASGKEGRQAASGKEGRQAARGKAGRQAASGKASGSRRGRPIGEPARPRFPGQQGAYYRKK